MNKILLALMRLRPNCEYSLIGDNLDDLVWINPKDTKTPTMAEIQAEIEKMDNEPAQADLAKEAAQAKLAALGLTTEDLKALGL